jgi:hypothetical protein
MLCQICGFKYKNEEMKLRWDGVWCCPEDWELRQPQDFVRGTADDMAVPYTAPEPGPSFSGPQPVPTGNCVVGTPAIYVNGVLKTSGVDYTIILPYGQVTFTAPPALGAAVQWTGTWLFNSGAQKVYASPFKFAIGDGSTAVFSIYWTTDAVQT